MSHVPPSYAPQYAPPPDESKTLYPQVPQQQPLAPQVQSAVTYYPPSGPPQQQPQQLVITPGPPVVVGQAQPTQSFVVHIVLSYVVTLCFGCGFGFIAFILASKWNTSIYQVGNRRLAYIELKIIQYWQLLLELLLLRSGSFAFCFQEFIELILDEVNVLHVTSNFLTVTF